VLLVGPAGGLSAQNQEVRGLPALSGVQTLRVDDTLTLAFTPTGQDDRAFALRLQAAGGRAQPNFLYAPLAVPNDPGFPGNSGVSVAGKQLYDQDYLTRIRAPEAWAAVQTAGKPLTAALTAVLDTGVDDGHPDLTGRLLPGRTFDNCGGGSDGAPEVSQGDRGHGTSSAGLIGAATDNGTGLAGLTWQGRNVLPVKVINEQGSAVGASTVSIRNGLTYAVEQGAKVVNMSLGIRGNPGDKALDDALASAASSAVLVAAAGNTSGDGIYYPASNANVIAVGAVGREDSLACYSARPGNASGSRQLDIVAPGGNAGTGTANCYASNPYDQLVLATRDQGGYTLRAGTSEAAPLVSGVAALIRSVNPNLSAAQVKGLLLGNTRQVNNLKFLDAEAAVKAALR
jgi:subtilisin family serine protease